VVGRRGKKGEESRGEEERKERLDKVCSHDMHKK